jgi:hypothetical protein
MSDKIELARTMRVGAEALRKIAIREIEPSLVTELLRLAREMDEHAAEMERSVASNQPLVGKDAVA